MNSPTIRELIDSAHLELRRVWASEPGERDIQYMEAARDLIEAAVLRAKQEAGDRDRAANAIPA